VDHACNKKKKKKKILTMMFFRWKPGRQYFK